MMTKKELLPIIQAEYSKVLGTKISKEKAWDLFKASLQTPFSALIENYKNAGSPALVRGETCDDLVMSLAGVGRFEIIAAGARKGKADSGDVDPRARLYVSSSLQNQIYEELGYTEYVTRPVKTAGEVEVETEDDVETASEEVTEETADAQEQGFFEEL